MAEEGTIQMTVTGTEENLTSFVEVCKLMDLMGRAGSSRTINVHYDGDGAARLRFDFGDTDVSGVEVDESVLDTGRDISIGIGN